MYITREQYKEKACELIDEMCRDAKEQDMSPNLYLVLALTTSKVLAELEEKIFDSDDIHVEFPNSEL